jgi:environmental stress-induced protein Ves
MKVWRAGDAVAMPWKNGGGAAVEYVRHPAEGDFDWRLSVARVEADGPFSTFPGVDRILVLLTGIGMDLDVDGTKVPLRSPLEHHCFGGEAAVHATLVEGATTDLNLMWRRDRWTAEFARHDGPARVDAPMVLAYVAAGQARLPDGTVLGPGDAFGRQKALLWAGDATVLVFALFSVR